MSERQHVELDSLDHQILALLHEDGRIPNTAIAKRLNVAEATVRKRLARLMNEGVLRVVGLTNPALVGQGVTAIVGVRTEGQDVEEIVNQIRSWHEVRYASICAGTYDLILEIAVASNDDLYRFLTKRLRTTAGIVGSDTSLVMKVVKDRHQWEGGYLEKHHETPPSSKDA